MTDLVEELNEMYEADANPQLTQLLAGMSDDQAMIYNALLSECLESIEREIETGRSRDYYYRWVHTSRIANIILSKQGVC